MGERCSVDRSGARDVITQCDRLRALLDAFGGSGVVRGLRVGDDGDAPGLLMRASPRRFAFARFCPMCGGDVSTRVRESEGSGDEGWR